MRTLHFSAKGQSLLRMDQGEPPRSGSEGYLCCEFDLDEEWDGLKVAVRYFDWKGCEHAAWLDSDSTCNVPGEVTDGRLFKVSLKGVGDGRTINTNTVTVLQEAVR